MPTMDWTSILSDMDVPAGWMMGAFLLTNVLSFFLARGTSKDKVNSTMLEQTVKRQKELDDRQAAMMDDLQGQFDHVRTDMSQIKLELSEERKRFTALSEKYSTLVSENYHLKQMAKNLSSENEELKLNMAALELKNREITDQMLSKARELEQIKSEGRVD